MPNLNDLHDFLTKLIQGGASTLAAAFISFCAGMFVLHLLRRRLYPDATAELHQRTTELAECRKHGQQLTEEKAAYKQQLALLKVHTESVEKDRSEKAAALQKMIAAAKKLAEEHKKATAALETAQQEIKEQAERISQLEASEQSLLTHQAALAKVQNDLATTQATLQETKQQLGDAASERDDYQSRYSTLTERIQQADRIWERWPRPDATPEFVAREKRHCPVIAVLNLKGGVGKTTLTANLSAILQPINRRVLMIDLDHQRTLSTMALPLDSRRDAHHQSQTFQHFLDPDLGDHSGERLRAMVCECPSIPGVDVVINTNPNSLNVKQPSGVSLEQVEERLHTRWLCDDSRDPRPWLRQALHSTAITDRYGYVFLDCPPRLSPSTYMAIAAADFILIPMFLDQVSGASVKYVIRELRRMRQGHHPLYRDFRILGVVPNSIHNGVIAERHQSLWDQLKSDAKKAWGEHVHFFNTGIRQCNNLGSSGSEEEAYQPMSLVSHPVAEDFAYLKQEIEKEIHE